MIGSCSSNALYSSNMGAQTTQTLPSNHFQPIVLSELTSIDWVRKCIEQYPEIRWLANAEVRKTEEGQAIENSSFSKQLFGQNFPEFDRTMMTLRCLQWILDGSKSAYLRFTADQPNEVKLSRESFASLHQQITDLIESHYDGMSKLELIQAMEASLILGDIGKSDQARELFRPYGARAPDHDDFHGEVMQILMRFPNLCPTFDQLTPESKHLLIQTANLAHYGHITHLEGGPTMFSKLKDIFPSISCIAFELDFLVHTCDVAGALGHANNCSSVVYNEFTHQTMQSVRNACLILANPQKTELDAYNFYLKTRADFLGLNDLARIDRALTRIGAMLRLFRIEDGVLLKQAISELNQEQQTKILTQVDIKEGEELKRTPTYMPAVLNNLSNNLQLGLTKEERLSQTIILGLPFLAKVLEAHKKALSENKSDPNIPLNFNKVAGLVKENPYVLLNEFTIDQEGNICIKN